jgi:hypothetical protein
MSNAAKKNQTPPPPVAEVDSAAPYKVISFVLDEGFKQVVQASHPFHQGEAATTTLLSVNPTVFFEHPVSSVFSPDNCGPQSDAQYILYRRKFSEAQEKKTVIQEVENSLAGKVKSTSLRADLIVIVDELITNAIFNAPFVDQENKTSGVSREDRSVRMHEGMSGEISVASDNDRILVVCRDTYGSLNPDKMLARVRNCYTQGVAANINMSGGGGAGIGSYMVFNSSISFFVAVHVGKSTVVGCVLPLKGSGRMREGMLKNLHYILLK